MADTELDLVPYLARIGYTGDRAPTLATLTAIHRRHPEAIAFENLDPLLGITPRLDVDGLRAKLIDGGRGGWCFEQNQLLRSALTALGFRTTALAARVMWGLPAELVRPRSHMLLLVHLDEGDWIADVGFGGLTLTAPLRLVADEVQTTPHESYRLTHQSDGYVLQVRIDDAWRPVYRFDRQPQEPADYEVTNWYLSNHPQSHFRAGLYAARPDGTRRYTLRDATLTVRHGDGRVEQTTLASASALRASLGNDFRLALPDDTALRDVLRRFASDA